MIKVMLCLKQKFLKMQPCAPAFISQLGKWCEQTMAHSAIPVKAIRLHCSSGPAAQGDPETADHVDISCSSSREGLLDGLLPKIIIRKSFLASFISCI